MTVDGYVYFHHLPRAEEAAYLVADPPELADMLTERFSFFVRDEPEPEPRGISIVAFIVRGPERVDRYGLMVREDALSGSVWDNLDSIRRTMPNGWRVEHRKAMV